MLDRAYSTQDSGAYFYLIARKASDGTVYRHSYGFYQYQNSRAVTTGDDMSSLGWSQQCSTLVAWALSEATGRTIATKYYSNAVVYPATGTLHSAVSNECDDGAGWFGGLFVNCDDIADQIVNCFTAEYYGDLGKCDDDHSSTWQSFRNSATASSVSPDRVNHGGGGPWDGGAQNSVYWNSGGSVYGCFF